MSKLTCDEIEGKLLDSNGFQQKGIVLPSDYIKKKTKRQRNIEFILDDTIQLETAKADIETRQEENEKLKTIIEAAERESANSTDPIRKMRFDTLTEKIREKYNANLQSIKKNAETIKKLQRKSDLSQSEKKKKKTEDRPTSSKNLIPNLNIKLGTSENPTIDNLSNELWNVVFNFLTDKELSPVALVCIGFYQLVGNLDRWRKRVKELNLVDPVTKIQQTYRNCYAVSTLNKKCCFKCGTTTISFYKEIGYYVCRSCLPIVFVTCTELCNQYKMKKYKDSIPSITRKGSGVQSKSTLYFRTDIEDFILENNLYSTVKGLIEKVIKKRENAKLRKEKL